ncbi:glycosyltransferase family 61 protein [Neoroseomonas lacus]|uniref:Glycosyltransferase 61 catalytic domain-containing protein n=1 Tax=Neoroseomonas lacus TaxID=287609 RepID=A0A917NMB7_9PROT|nr:glycosyltransferase 61 family protein [Neoroseomonas lacus]GGJ11463.1 hypothetical protein GCM10011320_18150 [Neoroseomonas lacus]
MNAIRAELASLPSLWRPPAQLNVETHDDVTLLPLDSLPLGAAPVRLRVGVFGAQGEVIETALHRRGRHRSEPLPAAPAEETWPGSFVYGGVLWDHFGHFLVESLARAWAFADNDGPILWLRKSPQQELRGWQREILDLLGLGDREHRVVTRPTRVDRLAVPEQGLVMWRYLHPRQEARLAAHPFRSPAAGRRVWLSRSGLPAGLARIEGEVEVEALLRAEGWTILRPETVSVAGQLAALDTAEMIAGFAGSAFHGLMLGRDVQARIVIFSRHPKVEVNYEMIAAAKGLDQRIVRLEHEPAGDGSARAGIRLTRPEDVTEALRAATLSHGSAA